MTEAPGLQRSLLEFMSERQLQGELASAPGAEKFMLHVQPSVDLSSGRIVGAEVIGRCVVGEAAAAAAGLRAIQPSFCLWFNVSARELNDPRWLERVAREGDSLQGLGVEITESDAMQNVPETLRVLTILKRAGLSIALDDFGSCYPLLAELRPLPIDVVKLDRSFSGAVSGDVRHRRIVGAIVSLGRRFRFEAIAQGVESAEQARALRDAGCRYGQGSYLGRPIPIHELLTLIDERPALAS